MSLDEIIDCMHTLNLAEQYGDLKGQGNCVAALDWSLQHSKMACFDFLLAKNTNEKEFVKEQLTKFV